jgi:hypothetical protein
MTIIQTNPLVKLSANSCKTRLQATTTTNYKYNQKTHTNIKKGMQSQNMVTQATDINTARVGTNKPFTLRNYG